MFLAVAGRSGDESSNSSSSASNISSGSSNSNGSGSTAAVALASAAAIALATSAAIVVTATAAAAAAVALATAAAAATVAEDVVLAAPAIAAVALVTSTAVLHHARARVTGLKPTTKKSLQILGVGLRLLCAIHQPVKPDDLHNKTDLVIRAAMVSRIATPVLQVCHDKSRRSYCGSTLRGAGQQAWKPSDNLQQMEGNGKGRHGEG
ncbi:hypothetical protein PoB_005003000 [Plakobranchus ocellatus]|uniref:Uncharacterized protein n=1 Tax=Plakobranchus ocellatus TaxID=259542 RepID=A0AAV4BW06_9GAST|nr:hypothetical protein PoB_005003000 [Plakobranchus ocellatus]